MTYFNNNYHNDQRLAAGTGIPQAVCDRWIRCEGQAVPNPTNPLNIIALLGKPGYPESGRPVQIARTPGGFGVYATVDAGIDDAIWLVKYGYVGRTIRAALAANPTDALAIAKSIEASPWATGHYGYSCISSAFAAGGTVVPQPLWELVAPWDHVNVRNAPGLNGTVVRVLRTGDKVTGVEVSGGMYHAGGGDHNAYVGWVKISSINGVAVSGLYVAHAFFKGPMSQ